MATPTDPTRTKAARTPNPPWDAEERVLALDLYLRRQTASKTDQDVIRLSAVLNDRAARLGISGDDVFRNPAGVALKLANFAALDPSYPGKGMQRHSRGDAETWDEFSTDSDRLALRVSEIMNETTVHERRTDPSLLPLEDDSTLEYQVTIDRAVRIARRREARLVSRFGNHLKAQGHAVGSRHHVVEGSRLRIDLIDDTDGCIWEAKFEVGRNAVRLAIGQLIDYRRFEPGCPEIGVLLSRRPSDDLVELCHSIGARVAYPDSQPGDFTVRAPR